MDPSFGELIRLFVGTGLNKDTAGSSDMNRQPIAVCCSSISTAVFWSP